MVLMLIYQFPPTPSPDANFGVELIGSSSQRQKEIQRYSAHLFCLSFTEMIENSVPSRDFDLLVWMMLVELLRKRMCDQWYGLERPHWYSFEKVPNSPIPLTVNVWWILFQDVFAWGWLIALLATIAERIRFWEWAFHRFVKSYVWVIRVPTIENTKRKVWIL